MTVTFHLPSTGHTNGYQHCPNSIEIQHTNSGWAGLQGAATRGPSVRFVDKELLSSRYTSEPILHGPHLGQDSCITAPATGQPSYLVFRFPTTFQVSFLRIDLLSVNKNFFIYFLPGSYTAPGDDSADSE